MNAPDEFSQALYDRSTVRSCLSVENVLEPVRRAFEEYASGRAQMPAKNYLYFDRHDGDLRTMSAYIPDLNLATVKIVNYHAKNPDQFDLPSVMALLVAVRPETGFPRAVMDATEITALRTAAASALATDLFADRDARVLGILGAGTQASYQIEGQLLVREFEEVLIYDLNYSRSQAVATELGSRLSGLEVQAVQTIDDILEVADVINSLTPSHSPLTDEAGIASLKSNVHVNAMGADAPGKQEWPLSIYSDFAIIIDDWEQARHSGEIQHGVEHSGLREEALAGTLGDLLLAPAGVPSGKTLFDSTGLAIQDTAGAHAVLSSQEEPSEYFSFFPDR